MVWDGLGFFGFSTHKLDRLKGEPVTWLTPLSNVKQVIMTLALIVIALYIIITEMVKLGTQKSSTIILTPNQEYKFGAREHMTLILGAWFYVDETIEHIRKWDAKNQGNFRVIKHKDDRVLAKPTDPEWNWFDHDFTEKFLCERVNTYFL